MDVSQYRPSEYRAILVHKYYLGIEWNCDPTFEEAVDSWESNHADGWRNQKMRRDVQAQIGEIDAYRDRISKERGAEVSWEDAAKEWVSTREEKWRDQWEATSYAGA
ncbi:MAG: hypothetical protein DHS20C16_05110 [Phycisphaerae bacterium]|nr:MAG: hypothetical protein DHS20C16_05110 [Phycisphaerae bacterium]